MCFIIKEQKNCLNIITDLKIYNPSYNVIMDSLLNL